MTELSPAAAAQVRQLLGCGPEDLMLPDADAILFMNVPDRDRTQVIGLHAPTAQPKRWHAGRLGRVEPSLQYRIDSVSRSSS